MCSHRRFAKFSIFFLVLCIFVLAVFLWWSHEDKLTKNLRSEISESAFNVPPVLYVANAVTFSWDQLYIFGPYTPLADIKMALGFPWPYASKTGIELSDSANLLVFVQDDRVVKHLMFPRSSGDFYLVSDTNAYTQSSAKFLVARKSPNRLVLMYFDKGPIDVSE